MVSGIGRFAILAMLGMSADATASPGSPLRSEVSVTSVDATVQSAAAMLPPRLLSCTLGRIANFDATKIQKPSDFVIDGRHAFQLFLPSIPVRTTPPPSAPLPPEPVDRRTRIVSDPDGLAHEARGIAFDRVVDDWPERVELTTPISDVAVNLIVIDRIKPSDGTAAMFMTKANDAVTFDLKHLYHGECRISTDAEAATRP